MLDSVYIAADNRRVTVLISLDLSAAFDTVDHAILLQRLQSEFGVTDILLSWLHSYLEGRTQFVKLGQQQSQVVGLDVGVPRGSVLGPLLCCLRSTAARWLTSLPAMACSITNSQTIFKFVSSWLPATRWEVSPFVQHARRTLDCGICRTDCSATRTSRRHAVTSAVSLVAVAGVELPVADEVKVLGVVPDRRLTFEKHVMMVARSCHYHAQAIRHIRHLLSTELASTLARSLILTRLDYCNSLIHGSHTSSIQTLQRVQNNAARIVLQAPRQFHANPLLRQLH